MTPSKRDLYLILIYRFALLTGRSKIRVRELFDNYNINTTPEEFVDYISHESNHALVVLSKGDISTWHRKVELTFDGETYVEENFGENAGAILEQRGISHRLSQESDNLNQTNVDSRLWTGLKFTASQREELVSNINDALNRIDDIGLVQDKKAQVRALLLAARTLSEAPEPPVRIIQMLLNDVDRIVGIAGLFVGIAGLILGMS